jgi:hypothetical protein
MSYKFCGYGRQRLCAHLQKIGLLPARPGLLRLWVGGVYCHTHGTHCCTDYIVMIAFHGST